MENFEHFIGRFPWLSVLAERGFRLLIIIAIVVVGAKAIALIFRKIISVSHKVHRENGNLGREREKRLETVFQLSSTAIKVFIYGIGVLMGLREMGLDIRPLLTGAGIAGVALGFGSQSLVKDVLSGFFLLIEDQIRVGDVVKINGGFAGTVERMELRVIGIRDSDGTLHLIPNGEIKSVSNMTYEFSRAVVEIPMSYKSDVQKVSEVLSGVVTHFNSDLKWKSEVQGPASLVGITRFEPTHMTLELGVKTAPHSRWQVSRELRARSKQALDNAGITMAV